MNSPDRVLVGIERVLGGESDDRLCPPREMLWNETQNFELGVRGGLLDIGTPWPSSGPLKELMG